MLRQDIIERLSSFQPSESQSQLELLYSCFAFKNDPVYERIKIQTWLQGCIESLYYRPNKYCLILVGSQGIGKTEFFRYISPNKNWALNTWELSKAQDSCHEFFFVCLDESLSYYSKVKQMRSLCQNQEYVIFDGDFPVSEKRIASYCGTTNEWSHPDCKWDLVVEIEKIDFQKFNSIDKNLLWSELFYKFKLK